MSWDPLINKELSRRSMIIGGIQALLTTTLLARLYFLQVVESDRYLTLAEDNRISVRLMAPARGEILDRNGVVLATNRQSYQLLMIAEQTKNVHATLSFVAELIDLSPQEIERIQKEVKRHRAFIPITIRQTLTWEEVAKIEVNAFRLSGIMIEPGQTRAYPFADVTAHAIGYVGVVAENERTGDPLLELPEVRIGKSGLERVYDEALRGKAGSRQVEVNAYGRVIRELSRIKGQPGQDVKTTIDARLQQFSFLRMGQENGTVILMDITTGDILSLISTPSFDPNNFAFGLPADIWKELNQNPRKPLINKAVAGEYMPGSTFKMLVALAALEYGRIRPDHHVFCTGSTKVGNHTFHCWRKGGHGPVNLTQGIAQSCDSFFYDVARRVKIDEIADMAQRFGLGRPVGIDIPGERGGLVPTSAWKKRRFGVSWQLGDTFNVAIGQGYILTTPIQLLLMTARLVNGGYAIQPSLVHTQRTDMAASTKIKVNANHLSKMVEAMAAVVNDPRGTAHSAVLQGLQGMMGGKTGTAQVRRITMAERLSGSYNPLKRPWHHRDHAFFIGFAPVERPRFAISVVVEHGLSGSKAAAPIARDVLAEAVRLYLDPSIKPLTQVGQVF